MGKIANRRTGFFLCFITGLLSGLLAGAALWNILVSCRIEEYHHKIKYLEVLLEDRDIKLKKLEESVHKRRYVLKEIEILLDFEGDELEKLSLEKHIKEKFNHLLGKEIREIDLDTAIQVVDKRIMTLDGRLFKCKVEKVILDETMRMWVSIHS